MKNIKLSEWYFYVLGIVAAIVSIFIPLASVVLIQSAFISVTLGFLVRWKVEKQKWSDQVAFMKFVAGMEV